ncbi:O-antigen polymerase [Cyclobacterium roseum]|uniref:O-antigen polymerase n=1 Tax=Cyclobacterium roseum TaxID=2666137 RepID=UPI00139183FE|nr:O-antigen polymerase [Cyclobacterium roseum]
MNTIDYSVNYQKYVNELNFNYKLFWMCVLVYSISGGLGSTFIDSLYKLVHFFQTISLLGIFYATWNIVQFKVNNKLLGIVLVIYFLWIIFITLYGFEFTYKDTKSVIFGGVFKYFFPLFLFFPRNLFFYKKLFTVIFILSIAYIIYNLIFFEEVTAHYDSDVNQKFIFEGFTRQFGIPLGFFLFTYIYHSKTRNVIVLLAVILMLGISVFRARRAIMVFSVAYLLIFMVIYYIYANRKVLMAVAISLVLFVASFFAGQIYDELRFSFFERIEERSTKNTREIVEAAFYRDFELQDWIIGRGINGRYWCPNADVNDTTGYRTMIETDYLNMILNGGSILLVLILLISIPAAYKAFFYSKNLLSKVAGIWIVLWILSLYPMNVFLFSVNYMIFWICVGIGYSNDVRKLSDETIKEAFKL